MMTVTASNIARIDGKTVDLVVWGWDCIDCGGDFGCIQQACDSEIAACIGANCTQ